jgi:outer membrane protein
MMNIHEPRQAFNFNLKESRPNPDGWGAKRIGGKFAPGVALALVALLVSLTGCGSIAGRPELNPDALVPPGTTQEWVPPPAEAREYIIPQAPVSSPAASPAAAYDLPDLIDLALHNNPVTRQQWQTARAAAAQFGAAQSPYYPQIAVESANGYQRTLIELPSLPGRLEQWQSQPVMELTYTLLDFGRRRSAAEAARNYMIASNFAFNRAVQDVVFNTESAFYSLDAAKSAVIAAQQNLRLAATDFDAVKQRVDLGLATEPQLLLAKERLAQSEFDLANSRLLVHDGEAQLAVALGLPANRVPAVEGLENQAVPTSLRTNVERLLASARRRRPDLAAKVASLRSSIANVSQARAQFWPVVGLSANYGENVWNFTLQTPRTVQTSQPQYSAMITVNWDAFTGFKRLNDLRQAEADREAARADLDSLEIDVAAQVWRAYYEFDSSLSKYAYAKSLLAAAEEAYEANLATYRQGLSTIVELLTAQRDLANARYTLIQSKAELLTAYAAVAYAAGSIK